MQETRVQSLGQEDPLEKEMATHSSILAWRIAQTEEPGGLQSVESQRVGHELATEQQKDPSWLSPFPTFLASIKVRKGLGIGGRKKKKNMSKYIKMNREVSC